MDTATRAAIVKRIVRLRYRRGITRWRIRGAKAASWLSKYGITSRVDLLRLKQLGKQRLGSLSEAGIMVALSFLLWAATGIWLAGSVGA